MMIHHIQFGYKYGITASSHGELNTAISTLADHAIAQNVALKTENFVLSDQPDTYAITVSTQENIQDERTPETLTTTQWHDLLLKKLPFKKKTPTIRTASHILALADQNLLSVVDGGMQQNID